MGCYKRTMIENVRGFDLFQMGRWFDLVFGGVVT